MANVGEDRNTQQEKGSYDILDYPFDFSEWLDDDVITGVVLLLNDVLVPSLPHTSVITIEAMSTDGIFVIVWLSGGAPLVRYKITCRASTREGRQLDRTLWLRIKAA